MYVSMWRKEIVHDDEVDLAAIRYLHPVKSVELGEKGIGVFVDVGVVVAQDLS